MQRFFQSFVLVLALAALSGCASIVSGGPQTLAVMSSPSGANCEVIDVRTGNTLVKTTTPDTLTLRRDAGFFRAAKYRVRISRDGYLPHEAQLDAGLNGWYFGNLLFGGLPGLLLVDPATGAMWRIHEEQINAVLFEDSEAGRAAKARGEEERRRAELAAQGQTEGREVF